LDVLVPKALAALCLPPGLFLLLAVAGLLWRIRHRAAGNALVLASLALLWLASMPPVGAALLRGLESVYPPLGEAPPWDDHSAIVVLGGGRYPDAPEYGEDSVSGPVLERMRYAVWLHRRSLLPVMVAGGNLLPGDVPESVVIAASLRSDFGVVPRWLETGSRTTRENARNSARVLLGAGITRVYLVTHAWHMPRAARAFRAAGLDVVPAPTMFSARAETAGTVLDWLPSMAALQATYVALYERLGALWYRLGEP